jgi:hypothetical protein
VLFAFSIIVTEANEPVCKLEAGVVEVRINLVALVNVTCVCFPCKLVTTRLLVPTFWIVPIETVGHFVVDVGVVDVEVFELALVVLPQAANNAANKIMGITDMSFFMMYLLLTVNYMPQRSGNFQKSVKLLSMMAEAMLAQLLISIFGLSCDQYYLNLSVSGRVD